MAGLWWSNEDQWAAQRAGWQLWCMDGAWSIAQSSSFQATVTFDAHADVVAFVEKCADNGDELAQKAIAYIIQEAMKKCGS